jgi:hypothetical protein
LVAFGILPRQFIHLLLYLFSSHGDGISPGLTTVQSFPSCASFTPV